MAQQKKTRQSSSTTGGGSATETALRRGDFVGDGGELHQVATGSVERMTTAQGIPVRDDQNSLRAADAAVVTDALLTRAHQPVEVFLDSSGLSSENGEAFDSMYDGGSDPWRFEDSWYEERKRTIVLASLLDRNLGRVLELGPATGLLTAALAERATHVTAVDISRRALSQVGTRLSTHGLRERVTLLLGATPQTWPDGSFDTVIASEVAYFLTAGAWRRALERATDSLTPEGSIIIVNWLHPVEGLDLDGQEADRIAAATPGLETVVEHREADFVLRILRRPGLPSPAATEGRTP
ncbi:MAG: methyltransferase domain-containing protein [Intrasporangiaceae bacterium]|nr:methyltransferase domain-containing protein [Intrasporangiaceae bacterium]